MATAAPAQLQRRAELGVTCQLGTLASGATCDVRDRCARRARAARLQGTAGVTGTTSDPEPGQQRARSFDDRHRRRQHAGRDEHERQRPRIAAPGDPRRERPRAARHDHVQHSWRWPAHDRADGVRRCRTSLSRSSSTARRSPATPARRSSRSAARTRATSGLVVNGEQHRPRPGDQPLRTGRASAQPSAGNTIEATSSAPNPSGTAGAAERRRRHHRSVAEQHDRRHDRRRAQSDLRQQQRRRQHQHAAATGNLVAGQLHRHERRGNGGARQRQQRHQHPRRRQQTTPSAGQLPPPATSSPATRDMAFASQDAATSGNRRARQLSSAPTTAAPARSPMASTAWRSMSRAGNTVGGPSPPRATSSRETRVSASAFFTLGGRRQQVLSNLHRHGRHWHAPLGNGSHGVYIQTSNNRIGSLTTGIGNRSPSTATSACVSTPAPATPSSTTDLLERQPRHRPRAARRHAERRRRHGHRRERPVEPPRI